MRLVKCASAAYRLGISVFVSTDDCECLSWASFVTVFVSDEEGVGEMFSVSVARRCVEEAEGSPSWMADSSTVLESPSWMADSSTVLEADAEPLRWAADPSIFMVGM